MDQLQASVAAMNTHIDTQMDQFMEIIQNVAIGQEELKQVVQRSEVVTTDHVNPPGVNLNHMEVLSDQNVRNTVQTHVNGTPHCEDIFESSFDTFSFSIEETESEKKLHLLEKRMKAIEGRDSLGLDALSLCLVPGIKIPAKFKIPTFEKYKGTSCPITHIKAYCNKMAPYAENAKLLMHVFQDSLSGASLEWYTQLERTHIQTWKELAEAFVNQYDYNRDMAPTRIQLQGLTQKTEESFKEYAQRWRELAATVQPPLLERELIEMFSDTLQCPYLIAGCTSKFSHLVVVGERFERGLKMGNIQDFSIASEFLEQIDEEESTTSEDEEEAP